MVRLSCMLSPHAPVNRYPGANGSWLQRFVDQSAERADSVGAAAVAEQEDTVVRRVVVHDVAIAVQNVFVDALLSASPGEMPRASFSTLLGWSVARSSSGRFHVRSAQMTMLDTVGLQGVDQPGGERTPTGTAGRRPVWSMRGNGLGMRAGRPRSRVSVRAPLAFASCGRG